MNITQAKKYLAELYSRGCSYHFEEAAVECLYDTGLASHSEALEIQKQIDKIRCRFAVGARRAKIFSIV